MFSAWDFNSWIGSFVVVVAMMSAPRASPGS